MHRVPPPQQEYLPSFSRLTDNLPSCLLPVWALAPFKNQAEKCALTFTPGFAPIHQVSRGCVLPSTWSLALWDWIISWSPFMLSEYLLPRFYPVVTTCEYPVSLFVITNVKPFTSLWVHTRNTHLLNRTFPPIILFNNSHPKLSLNINSVIFECTVKVWQTGQVCELNTPHAAIHPCDFFLFQGHLTPKSTFWFPSSELV